MHTYLATLEFNGEENGRKMSWKAAVIGCCQIGIHGHPSSFTAEIFLFLNS